MPKPLQPGVLYSREEIKRRMTPSAAKHWQAKGYVLQFDVNTQKMLLTHSTKAAGTGVTGTGSFAPVPTIQKRTHAQRVDSLMVKLVEDMKKEGGIKVLQTGIAPDVYLGNGKSRPATQAEQHEAARRKYLEEEAIQKRISEIVGAAWVAGRTEITADVVRQVASSLLGQSEAEHEELVSHRTTRHVE